MIDIFEQYVDNFECFFCRRDNLEKTDDGTIYINCNNCNAVFYFDWEDRLNEFEIDNFIFLVKYDVGRLLLWISPGSRYIEVPNNLSFNNKRKLLAEIEVLRIFM